MLDQSVFTETIHEVQRLSALLRHRYSKEEILSYFKRDGVERTAGKHGFRVSADTT